MAVPFVMPEEQNADAEAELIITQLHLLLNRLQTLLRRTRMVSSPSQHGQNRLRVRSAGRTRIRDETRASTSSANRPQNPNIPDLLSNLAMIAAATNDAVVASSSQHNYQNPIQSPRRRNSSESSNCEETKISITAVVNHSAGHWNQVGVNLPKIPEVSNTALLTEDDDECLSTPTTKFFSGDSFLSKFVPGPASAPLWTAMICFVGWHLFKAR